MWATMEKKKNSEKILWWNIEVVEDGRRGSTAAEHKRTYGSVSDGELEVKMNRATALGLWLRYYVWLVVLCMGSVVIYYKKKKEE